MKSDSMENEQRKQLFTRLSHDVRTPMNAIVGFTGLALQSEQMDEIKKYLWDIRCASRQLMQVISENLGGEEVPEDPLQLIQDWKSYQKYTGDTDSMIAQRLHGGADILLVDDNELNLKVAETLLKQYGLEPDKACGAKEAVEMAKKKPYQLIFMDYMMPEMDGRETMEQIRACEEWDYSEVPIVALTANVVQGVREAMMGEGFDDYLSKPIYKKSLEGLLLKWISDPIPGVQIQQGITNCGEDEEIYHSILEFIVENGEEKAEDLDRFLEQEDFENYTIAVHALKSTLANIGAMDASEMARKLEFAGKEGRYEEIRQEHAAAMTVYRDILKAIGKYLKNKGNICSCLEEDELPEEIQEETEVMTREEVKMLLKDVRILLESFQYDEAEGVLRDLQAFEMEQSLKEQLQGVLRDISNYHMEEAVLTMEQICQE